MNLPKYSFAFVELCMLTVNNARIKLCRNVFFNIFSLALITFNHHSIEFNQMNYKSVQEFNY